MQQIDVTLWRSFARGRCDRHTWRSFVETFVHDPEVVRDKRSVAGFSLACFEDNRRSLARVEHVHALVLDLDHGTPTFEAVEHAFPKTRGVAYTTFSHTPEAPRLRAVFPHSRPITADEHNRIWAWAKRKCAGAGLELDPVARDASHLFFLPSHPPGAEYLFHELRGRSIDVDKALSTKWLRELSDDDLRQIAHTSTAVPGKNGSSQATAMRGVDRSASGRDWHLCLRLMREGLTNEAVADELRRVSVKYPQKGESYLLYTVGRAREAHEASTPVMGVQKAILHCLPPRFAHPERRHIHLELEAEDGELAQTQIIVPAPWHAGAVGVTWRACFPDIEPDSLLGPWEETREIWEQIRWRNRLFEVAIRDEEVRWIRAAGASGAPQSRAQGVSNLP